MVHSTHDDAAQQAHLHQKAHRHALHAIIFQRYQLAALLSVEHGYLSHGQPCYCTHPPYIPSCVVAQTNSSYGGQMAQTHPHPAFVRLYVLYNVLADTIYTLCNHVPRGQQSVHGVGQVQLRGWLCGVSRGMWIHHMETKHIKAAITDLQLCSCQHHPCQMQQQKCNLLMVSQTFVQLYLHVVSTFHSLFITRGCW